MRIPQRLLIPSLLLGLFLLTTGKAQAQEVIAAPGQWTAYLSHRYTVDIAVDGNSLYAITQGGLFTYDIASGETRTFSTIEGLSNITPTTMLHDESSGIVFVGFQNGMINYFTTPDDINYITDIYRTDQFTSKTIRKFVVNGNLLYIATDFGIVVYDIDKKETRYSITKIESNLSGSLVRDITIADGKLWASMETKGLFCAPLSSPNITVPSVWTKVTGTDSLPAGNCKFVANTGDLIYAEVGGDIYRKWATDSVWSTFGLPNATWTYMETFNGVFEANYSWNMYLVYPDSSRTEIINWSNIGCGYVDANNRVWIGDVSLGLQKYETGTITSVGPAGPNSNYVIDVVAGNGEVYWAPRGKKGPSDRWYDKNGINYFNFRGDGMKVLDYTNGGLDPNRIFMDFARAYYDEKTGRTFMGSWGDGVVELLHGDTVRCIVNHKDPLSTLPGDGSCRVSGVALDNEGNLWITIIIADYRVNVISPDGTFHYFQLSNVTPIGILIDDYGNKWLNNQGQGIYVINDNGTLDNKADDQMRAITSDLGRGGLPNNSVLSIEKDLDGAVWVGTSEGAVVFYDPGSIFSTTASDASCPIVDGYCLLRDQKVNAIAVDGANRKWFATDNGVYVMSPDGTTQVAHYDIENSPLFDNGVKEICIDQSTGEVFMGTDKGLISLQGDATRGEDTCSITVFPNPLYTDYTGSVSIRGLGAESKVKITQVSGLLVKEIESLGGAATWDGKDMYGNAVRPGIYLVMSADDDKQNACIGKIAVVERHTK